MITLIIPQKRDPALCGKKQITQIYFLSIAFIFMSITASVAQEWQELKDEHFIVYFTQEQKFAKEALDKAEGYYRRIASDLGYPRYKEFWLWDKRVKIYIYPDHASYIKATGQPEWSQGMADYKNKQIASFTWAKGFLESILPHETAHLIFRDFVGFVGEIPLWLDEGVAQWAEEAKRKDMKLMAKELYEKDGLLSIEDMMKLDIRNTKDKNLVYIRPTRTKKGDMATLLLSADKLITTYYLQAVSLVGFLIEKYGSDRFAEFCRQLRDGKKLDEALRFTYPTYISSLDELERKWREYLEGG